MFRKARLFAVALWLLTGIAVGAQPSAENYPQRPVRLIVPFAPGGASDIVGRIVAPKLTELFGQQVIVDNRAGASGNIALELAAKAQPDGHTLLLGNVSTSSINPILFASVLRFDPARELAGITMLAAIPNALITSAAFPPNTLAEFIAYAKARPGQLNHGGTVGAYSHLDMLQLFQTAGIRLVHVPSRGGAGTGVTAIINGEVHITYINLATTGSLIKSGRIKAYAVTTDKRLPEFPNVPTMAEAGFPGIGTSNWNGVFAPARTPRPIIDKLHASLLQVMKRQDVQELLSNRIAPIVVSKSPAEFDAFVLSEKRKWMKIIKENNVKIE